MANKVLVAVFSASGVTRKAGEKIAQICGGDFFGIEPKEIYTADDLNWMDKNVRGNVKWEKGVQINRPDETAIRKWLNKVL